MQRKKGKDEFQQALSFLKDKIDCQKRDENGCVHIAISLTEKDRLKHFIGRSNRITKNNAGIMNTKFTFIKGSCDLKIHAEAFEIYYKKFDDDTYVSDVSVSQPVTKLNIPIAPRTSSVPQTESHDTRLITSNSADNSTNTNVYITQHSDSSNIPSFNSSSILLGGSTIQVEPLTSEMLLTCLHPQFLPIQADTQNIDTTPSNVPFPYDYRYQTQSNNNVAPVAYPYQTPISYQDYGRDQFQQFYTTTNVNSYIENQYLAPQQLTTSTNDSSNNEDSYGKSCSEEVEEGVVSQNIVDKLLDQQNQLTSLPDILLETLRKNSEEFVEETLEFLKNKIAGQEKELFQDVIKEKTSRELDSHNKKHLKKLVDAKTGIETTLAGKALDYAKNRGDVITQCAWDSRIYYRKLIDSQTGDETILEGKALDDAKNRGDVITQSIWNYRQRKKRKITVAAVEPMRINMKNLTIIEFLKSRIEARIRKGNIRLKNNGLLILYLNKDQVLWIREQLDNDLKMNLGISGNIICKGKDNYRLEVNVTTFNQYIQNQNLITQTPTMTTTTENIESNLEPSAVERAIYDLNFDPNEMYKPQIYPFEYVPQLSSFEGSLINHLHDGRELQYYDSQKNDEFGNNESRGDKRPT